MRVVIDIACDGGAFGDTPEGATLELARILTRLVLKTEDLPPVPSFHEHVLLDTNGNTVGHIEVTDD